MNLGKEEAALVVAERSRARSLGEVLLDKYKHTFLNMAYPLTLHSIKQIAASQECPIVYLSYTGARLLLWLLIPHDKDCAIYNEVVEVDKLEQEKFDGKPFDHFVCHSVSRAANTVPTISRSSPYWSRGCEPNRYDTITSGHVTCTYIAGFH